MTQIITDRATATIGDATIYGSLNKTGDEISFTGSLFAYKTPLKNGFLTLQRRLKNLKKCTIKGYKSDLFASTESNYKLTSYNVSCNWSGTDFKIGFVLTEIKESR